jgi:hypothetical protein
MSTKKGMQEKLRAWIDVRKQYHLSHAHIQMARELGMNPKKFGKIANHKQEPWKTPLPDFIEALYFKRFGKNQPLEVKSIEQLCAAKEQKKAEGRARQQLRKQNVAPDSTESKEVEGDVGAKANSDCQEPWK